MSWLHSLSWFKRSGLGRAGSTRCLPVRRSRRLQIEALEERWVPATLTVTNLNDDGRVFSLRETMMRAQPRDTINFAPGLHGTITLFMGSLVVQKDVTIQGPGADQITISGNNRFTVFYVSADMTRGVPFTLNLSGVTIANGNAAPTPPTFYDPLPGGGGIYNSSGIVSLSNCVVTGCHALSPRSFGGAIINTQSFNLLAPPGEVTITNCNINGNTANNSSGGAIYNDTSPNYPNFSFNDCTVTISNSTISGNTGTDLSGGGIYNLGWATLTDCLVTDNVTRANNVPGVGAGIYNAGSMSLVRVTVANNVGPSDGGGIYNKGSATLVAQLVATDCTIANNRAAPSIASTSDGGGIWNNDGELTLNSCTMAGNNANRGGGVFVRLGSVPQVLLRDTIIATNTSNSPTNGPDVSGRIDQGPDVNPTTHNLIGNGIGSTGIVDRSVDPNHGNQVGTPLLPIDPLLGNLQNNSGPLFGAPSARTPVLTMALLPNGPAIDMGARYFGLPTSDQRGTAFNRIINGTPDIGAYEFQPPLSGTTLRSSLNPAPRGQTVTFTATVTLQAPGSNDPLGTVTFMDGATPLGPPVTLVNGIARLSTSSLRVGHHAITAAYNGYTVGDYRLSSSMSSPALDQVIVRSVGETRFFAVGGAPGRVHVYRPDGTEVADFQPYGAGYTGGVSVAVGDVNDAGVYDLVTATTDGIPDVRVYDGNAFDQGTFDPNNPNTSLLVPRWLPYGNFNVGANVAVGDIEGNGFADIVTGPTMGNPNVHVYRGQDIADGTFNPVGSSLIANWFPYALNFNVGANVAVGDVNHDGFADIVTGATQGNPHVIVYNGADLANGTFDPSGSSILAQWFAYGLNFNVGVTVAVGDTDGTGFGNVITGATRGNPEVRVWSGQDIANHTFDPSTSLIHEFFAYAINENIGVRVGSANFEGPGTNDDIITGSTTSPRFRVVHGDSSGVLPPAILDVTLSDIEGGIYVGA
jgi:hypothetical protein